jgi:hypothetical protein
MNYSQNRDIGWMMIWKYIWLIILWGYWMNWSDPEIGQNMYGTKWPSACNESVHSWLLVRMECSGGLWREVPSCQELFLSQWCDGMCVTSPEAEVMHSRRDSMQLSGIPRHSTARRNSYCKLYVTCGRRGVFYCTEKNEIHPTCSPVARFALQLRWADLWDARRNTVWRPRQPEKLVRLKWL